jgi:hypothetical protein
VEYELANAIAELNEFYEFYMEIAELPPREMVEKVEERDPSFMEHIEAMAEPPKSPLDFWTGFGIWTITGLREKYRHIWHEAIHAYFQSDLYKKVYGKAKLQSDIERILRDTGFE